jgi:hypothetical protein
LLLYLAIVNCNKYNANIINCSYTTYQSIGIINDTLNMLQKIEISFNKKYFNKKVFIIQMTKANNIVSCSLDVNIEGYYLLDSDTLYLIYNRIIMQSVSKYTHIIEKYVVSDNSIELADIAVAWNRSDCLFKDLAYENTNKDSSVIPYLTLIKNESYLKHDEYIIDSININDKYSNAELKLISLHYDSYLTGWVAYCFKEKHGELINLWVLPYYTYFNIGPACEEIKNIRISKLWIAINENLKSFHKYELKTIYLYKLKSISGYRQNTLLNENIKRDNKIRKILFKEGKLKKNKKAS